MSTNEAVEARQASEEKTFSPEPDWSEKATRSCHHGSRLTRTQPAATIMAARLLRVITAHDRGRQAQLPKRAWSTCPGRLPANSLPAARR